MPIGTKRGGIVTYLEGLLPIELPDPLVTWSCKIMRQTNPIISPLLQRLWPLNVAGW